MTYRAISVSQFGGPEVLKLVELPLPNLSANQVLVSLKAAGINPVDTYIRTGNYVRKPALPYTPGTDGAGIIEQFADDSDHHPWNIGDRVFLTGSVTGTYAEKAVCNLDQLHRLPESISFTQGAAIYIPYATAYCALFHLAKARPSETILVHGGSGGVGLAAIQLAKARGIRVLATASADVGLEAVKRFGAEPFCHKEENYVDQIIKATNGRGVDVILEMLANVNLETDVSKLVANRGRTVIIGSRGSIEINPRSLMGKNSQVIGMALANSTKEELNEAFSAIEQGLQNGTLSPVIDSFATFSLADAPQAHEHVINRPSGIVGKVVLNI